MPCLHRWNLLLILFTILTINASLTIIIYPCFVKSNYLIIFGCLNIIWYFACMAQDIFTLVQLQPVWFNLISGICFLVFKRKKKKGTAYKIQSKVEANQICQNLQLFKLLYAKFNIESHPLSKTTIKLVNICQMCYL